MSTEFSDVFALEPAEKLQLVEDLWDEIAATPENVPVTDWQKEELARRKAEMERHPDSGRSWDEVKNRIRRSH